MPHCNKFCERSKGGNVLRSNIFWGKETLVGVGLCEEGTFGLKTEQWKIL